MEFLDDKACRADWDCKRLIREYFKLAPLVRGDAPYESLSEVCQVKLQRLSAAISAFYPQSLGEEDPKKRIGSLFVDGLRKLVRFSPLGDIGPLGDLLRDAARGSRRFEDVWKRFDPERDREQMLMVLLDYRVEAQELTSFFSGAIEMSRGGILAREVCKNSYDPSLNAINDKIDRIIALLMGTAFDKSFSVDELVKNYGYPTVTDSELLDRWIDDM